MGVPSRAPTPDGSPAPALPEKNSFSSSSLCSLLHLLRIWCLRVSRGGSQLPDVNQFLLQYFINYNLKKGWYLTWQPTLTANWEATKGDRWVVPLGGGVGRIMKLGNQPVNLTV